VSERGYGSSTRLPALCRILTSTSATSVQAVATGSFQNTTIAAVLLIRSTRAALPGRFEQDYRRAVSLRQTGHYTFDAFGIPRQTDQSRDLSPAFDPPFEPDYPVFGTDIYMPPLLLEPGVRHYLSLYHLHDLFIRGITRRARALRVHG
jgi:hypothetical protein